MKQESQHQCMIYEGSGVDVVSGEEFVADVMLAKLEDLLNQALKDGYKGLWLEYELKLEEMMHRRKELCGVCQYHFDSLPKDAMRQSLLVHSHVVINQTPTTFNPYYLKSSWPADLSTSSKLDEMITNICRH